MSPLLFRIGLSSGGRRAAPLGVTRVWVTEGVHATRRPAGVSACWAGSRWGGRGAG
jgi:hypothetical protein